MMTRIVIVLSVACTALAWTPHDKWTNCWPSTEYPRELSEQIMQGWSGTWERLQVCGLDLPTAPETHSVTFDGSIQWFTNGVTLTNAAGWVLTQSSGTPLITNATWRALGRAIITPPTRLMGDCFAFSITWANNFAAGAMTEGRGIQASSNGVDWADVAALEGPVSGVWKAERIAVLSKGFQYRMNASAKYAGGVDTLSISNATFESAFYRQGWTNVVAMKERIAAVAPNFIDMRAGVGTNLDMTTFLSTNPAFIKWTASNLAVAVGAPLDYWTNTPPRGITEDANGIQYIPAALDLLVATETPFRWACSTDPTETNLNARGFHAIGWYTNLSDGAWDATKSNIEAVLMVDAQAAIAPAFEWHQHTPYWYGFDTNALFVDVTNAAMPYVWAGGTNPPWTYSAGGLFYDVTTNDVETTNDLYSPGYVYTDTTEQVSATYTSAVTSVVWTVDSERFAGFVRVSTNVTGIGDVVYVTNDVVTWHYVPGTVTGTVVYATNTVLTNINYRAGTISQHAYAYASNSIIPFARDVDWYYRAGPAMRPPMVNSNDWDERILTAFEYGNSPDFFVPTNDMVATFEATGSERISENFLRITENGVTAAGVVYTGLIGRAGQTSTNTADWLPTWADRPTVAHPATSRGWAITNAIAVERWDFEYK